MVGERKGVPSDALNLMLSTMGERQHSLLFLGSLPFVVSMEQVGQLSLVLVAAFKNRAIDTLQQGCQPDV